MKTIFIVIGDFGSWDSHRVKNFKTFKNKEDADKYVEKANRVLGEFSLHLGKVYKLDEERRHSYLGMSMEEIEETDEYKLASKIYNTHWKLQEFNKCIIEEIELL